MAQLKRADLEAAAAAEVESWCLFWLTTVPDVCVFPRCYYRQAEVHHRLLTRYHYHQLTHHQLTHHQLTHHQGPPSLCEPETKKMVILFVWVFNL